MDSNTIEERRRKINNLRFFSKTVEERIKFIARELNWNYEKLNENEVSTVFCSICPSHRVKSSNIREHEEKCRWLEEGYQEDDVPFPEHHGTGSCIVFTSELQEVICEKAALEGNFPLGKNPSRNVPQTLARLNQEFNRNEKLALYDYVIANTNQQKICTDFSVLALKEEKSTQKIMTPLEMAAAERDARRRRASYRNKVHTNRKTQTEILREVIESQMDLLREEISSRNELPKKEFHGRSNDDHINGSYSSRHPETSRSCAEQCTRGRLHHTSRDKYRCKHHSKSRDSRESRFSEYQKSKERKRSRSTSYEISKCRRPESSNYLNCHRDSVRY